MKIKNSIKKVGAVAGSAVMVGMTMGAAAALSDFPTPFVEDGEVHSQIVVGTAGHQADVVGAINVAAALGQAAVQTTEETVPGAVSADVDGHDAETPIRDKYNGETAQLTLDKSDYSGLVRETVEVDDTDHFILERVHVTQSGVTTFVNETGQVTYTEVDEGALQYEVSYSPGFEAEQTIQVLGNEYTITEITEDTNNEVRLGSKDEHRNLEVGDSVDHGPWSFTIIDISSGDDDRVRVDVYEDGEFVTSQTLETGQPAYEFGDDNEFQIDVDDIWFGANLNQVHLDTVYTDTIVTEGEDSPFDEDWTVDTISLNTAGDAVEGLTLSNKLEATDSPDEDEDQVAALVEGSSLAGPAGYFDLHDLGLTHEDTEELSFGEDLNVEFTDANHLSASLNLDELLVGDGVTDTDDGYVAVETTDGERYAVEIADVTGDDLTLSYHAWEHTFTDAFAAADNGIVDIATGYGFSVTVDMTADIGAPVDVYADNTPANLVSANPSVHTSFGAELSYTDGGAEWDGDATADVIEVDEEGATSVFVIYDSDGEKILGVANNAVDTAADWVLDADGEETLSNFGSAVTAADDDSATVLYPENQRYVQHAVGSVGEVTGGDETYTAVDLAAQGNLPDMARLDTEVTESNKANNHLILVGGPAVNQLVAELGDEDKTRTLDEWRDNYDAGDSYVHLVEDAFVEGQHALVVAGYEADDTRNAAQYLANYGANADALADAGSELTLTSADFTTEN